MSPCFSIIYTKENLLCILVCFFEQRIPFRKVATPSWDKFRYVKEDLVENFFLAAATSPKTIFSHFEIIEKKVHSPGQHQSFLGPFISIIYKKLSRGPVACLGVLGDNEVMLKLAY